MTYYWLDRPLPRFVERIYIACITQHDKSLDVFLPYPQPETVAELRADLDCYYEKYDWILNGGIPDVGKARPHKFSSAVWEALLEHRANLEILLDKYGDQVVRPIARICSRMWESIRPYLRTKWRNESDRDWERKRTIAKLLLALRRYPNPNRFPLRDLMDDPSASRRLGTVKLPLYKP